MTQVYSSQLLSSSDLHNDIETGSSFVSFQVAHIIQEEKKSPTCLEDAGTSEERVVAVSLSLSVWGGPW